MTRKQQLINELMEGMDFPYANEIRRKLNRRTLDVIEFYYNDYKHRGVDKKYVIQNIISLG